MKLVITTATGIAKTRAEGAGVNVVDRVKDITDITTNWIRDSMTLNCIRYPARFLQILHTFLWTDYLQMLQKRFCLYCRRNLF